MHDTASDRSVGKTKIENSREKENKNSMVACHKKKIHFCLYEIKNNLHKHLKILLFYAQR